MTTTHLLNDEIEGLKHIGRQRKRITGDDGAAAFSMAKFASQRALHDDALKAAVADLRAEGTIA